MEREGFLTPEQEKQLDKLIELKGVAEALDGTFIKLADNKGLEHLKKKLKEEHPEVLPIVYEIIDSLFEYLPE